jgi:hypothetical protein
MTDDEKTEKNDAREGGASPTPDEEAAAEPQEEPGGGAATESQAAPEESEAPREETTAEDLRPLDVYAVLRVSIAQLSGVAFQTMGLQADPITNKVHKDLEQARVAIDAAAALVDKLLPHLQGQEAKDCKSLLTDLRLNFLRQSGEDKESE